MVGILTLISMLIGSSPQVFAELIFRGGYLAVSYTHLTLPTITGG